MALSVWIRTGLEFRQSRGGTGHDSTPVEAGDALTLTFDVAAKALRKANVNSYLDDPSDAVTLEVDFQTLPDGTNYL